MINTKEFCKIAVDGFGDERQIRQVQEEMSELDINLHHYLRNDRGCHIDTILEEIADVKRGIEQLEYIFVEKMNNQEKFQEISNKKAWKFINILKDQFKE